MEILILPQFLAIEPRFVRKGCAEQVEIAILPQFLIGRTSFRAKGLRGTTWTSQFYLSFWRSNLISCERVARDDLDIAVLPQFLAIEPHFVRKGLRRTLWNRNFTSVFGDRNLISCERVAPEPLTSQFYLSFWRSIEPHFVRKGCVSCRLIGTAPAPAFRREIEKKERARGQEDKRRRCEDVRARGQEGKKARAEDVKMWKMWRCEDEKMWRWADVKMWRCEDEKMWRCEDEKMWRWEDVKMRRCEDVRMWSWEDEKMWRWEDVKMRRCEDEKMWRWEYVKMRRWDKDEWEDEKMRRLDEDVKMRICEDEKMRYRPPLLEEPCAQTLSGKKSYFRELRKKKLSRGVMLEPWRHWQLKTLTWTTPMHPYLCFERKHCGRWKRLGTLRWPQCQSCGCLTNFDAMHQNKQKIDCNRGGRSFCCTGSELTPPPIFASMQNTHLDSSDLFPANVLDVLCTRDSELLGLADLRDQLWNESKLILRKPTPINSLQCFLATEGQADTLLHGRLPWATIASGNAVPQPRQNDLFGQGAYFQRFQQVCEPSTNADCLLL